MELQSNAMIARKKASEKMLLSNDKTSQVMASEIDPINGEQLEGLRLHNVQANKRKTTWAYGDLNISQKSKMDMRSKR